MAKQGGKGKGSSANRKARYAAYAASGRRDVNKAVKLVRHIERYGLADDGTVRDAAAVAALTVLRNRNLSAVKAADKITAQRREANALRQQ